MADRRMFSKSIVLSDAFLDMPMSARCLYFTLSMLADDDGFINSPKSVMRQCGASQDDMSVLIGKRFIIPFESGVVVIKHWRLNNYLRGDRYHETNYVEEKGTLSIEDNGSYTQVDKTDFGIPSIGIPSIGKDSIGKDSIGKVMYGEFHNVALTNEELEKLKEKFEDYEERIERLSSYIASKGKKYKSHYATILTWAKKDTPKSSLSKEF